jgi:2-dehydro-3-deoxygluconokinase
MPRVITFGEVMMRLATPGHLRFSQTNSLEMTFGGGEANVAVSLANYGIDAAFVTRLPKNDLAQTCINQLRGFGVDTRHIIRGGERVGIYFLESGASQRASTVTYDRAHSAISEIDAKEVDWSKVFAEAEWFHFTGITPALSPKAAAATLEAAKAAKRLGLTVSADLNYRKKLWTTAKAKEVMTEICQYVDVCIANEEDAEKVFGIKASGTDVHGGKIDHARYIEVAEKLTQQFKFKGVAITLRESFSASHNGWSGLYYTEGKGYFSRRYDIQIVDRVGGGDSFGGGLIYALVSKKSPQEVIEFAVAASCLKHSISGDYNLVSLKEVETLLQGDGSGRVQR